MPEKFAIQAEVDLAFKETGLQAVLARFEQTIRKIEDRASKAAGGKPAGVLAPQPEFNEAQEAIGRRAERAVTSGQLSRADADAIAMQMLGRLGLALRRVQTGTEARPTGGAALGGERDERKEASNRRREESRQRTLAQKKADADAANIAAVAEDTKTVKAGTAAKKQKQRPVPEQVVPAQQAAEAEQVRAQATQELGEAQQRLVALYQAQIAAAERVDLEPAEALGVKDEAGLAKAIKAQEKLVSETERSAARLAAQGRTVTAETVATARLTAEKERQNRLERQLARSAERRLQVEQRAAADPRAGYANYPAQGIATGPQAGFPAAQYAKTLSEEAKVARENARAKNAQTTAIAASTQATVADTQETKKTTRRKQQQPAVLPPIYGPPVPPSLGAETRETEAARVRAEQDRRQAEAERTREEQRAAANQAALLRQQREAAAEPAPVVAPVTGGGVLERSRIAAERQNIDRILALRPTRPLGGEPFAAGEFGGAPAALATAAIREDTAARSAVARANREAAAAVEGETRAAKEAAEETREKAAAEQASTTATKAGTQATRRQTSQITTSTQERRNQDARMEAIKDRIAGAASIPSLGTVAPTAASVAGAPAGAATGTDSELAAAKSAAAEQLEAEAKVTELVVSAERRLEDAKKRAALALGGEWKATERDTAETAKHTRETAKATSRKQGEARAGRPTPESKTEKKFDPNEALTAAIDRTARQLDVYALQLEELTAAEGAYYEQVVALAKAAADRAEALSKDDPYLDELGRRGVAGARTRAGVATRVSKDPDIGGIDVEMRRASNRRRLAFLRAAIATGDLARGEAEVRVEAARYRYAIAKAYNNTAGVAQAEGELKVELLKLQNAIKDAAANTDDYADAMEQAGYTSARDAAARAAGRERFKQEQGIGGRPVPQTGFGRVNEALQGPGLANMLGRRLITTASFGVAGLSFRGAIQGIGSIIKQAEELQRLFSQIEEQFKSADQAAQFPAFRESMLEIARDTGIAASEVAHVGFQIKGVYGRDTALAVRETGAAMRAALVTGLPEREIVDSLTAASLAFGVSIDTITDKAIGIEERFGVLSAESIKFFGDISSTAELTGLTIDELGTTLGVLQQKLGVSGGALAEQFSRLLGSVTDNLPQLVEIFDRFPTLAARMPQFQESLVKGSGAALFELARGWHTLGDAQQQAIAKQLGGTRQFQTTMNALEGLNEQILKGNVYIDDSGKAVERETNLQRTFGQQMDRTREALRQFGDTLVQIGTGTVIADLLYGFRGILEAIQAMTAPLQWLNDVTGSWFARVLTIMAAMAAMRVTMGTIAALSATFMRGGVPGVVQRVTGAAGGAAGAAAGPLTSRAPGVLGFFGLRGQQGALGQRGQRRLLGEGGVYPEFTWRSRRQPVAPRIDDDDPFSQMSPLPPTAASATQVAAQNQRERSRVRAKYNAFIARRRAARVNAARTMQGINAGTAQIEAESARAAAQANMQQTLPGMTPPVPAAGGGFLKAMGGRALGFLNSPTFIVGSILLGSLKSAASQRAEATRTAVEEARTILEQEVTSDMEPEEAAKLKAKQAEIRALALDEDSEFQRFLQRIPFFGSKSKSQGYRELLDQMKVQERAPEIQQRLDAFGKADIMKPEGFFGGSEAELQKALLKLNQGDEDTADKLEKMIEDRLGLLDPQQRAKYEGVLEAIKQSAASSENMENVRKKVETVTRLRSIGQVSEREYLARLEENRTALQGSIDAFKRSGQTPPDDLLNAALDAIKAVQDAQKEVADRATEMANAAIEVLKSRTGDPAALAGYNIQQALNNVNNAKEGWDRAVQTWQTSQVDSAKQTAEMSRQDELAAAQAELTEAQQQYTALSAAQSVPTGWNPVTGRPTGYVQGTSPEMLAAAKARVDAAQAAVDRIKNMPPVEIPKPPDVPADRTQWTDKMKSAWTEYLNQQAQYNQYVRDQQKVENDIEDARTRLNRARAGQGKNALVLAQRQKEDAQRALERAKEEKLGLAAELNAQADIIEADRAIADAMFDITQARLGLLAAVHTAAGRDAEAAKLATRQVQEELDRQMKLDPTDELSITQLRTRLTQQRDQEYATWVSERRQIIDFQREMGEITVGQAIGQLQALLASPQVQANEDRIREIKLAIRSLQKEAAGELQFNIGDLRLPTLYEARRSITTRGMGVGYNDNRQVSVNIVVNNNGDLDGALQAFSEAMNAPSRFGTEPRFNFARN